MRLSQSVRQGVQNCWGQLGHVTTMHSLSQNPNQRKTDTDTHSQLTMYGPGAEQRSSSYGGQ